MDSKTPNSSRACPVVSGVSGRQGFTLIELIVAVSISLFVTGLLVINYNSYNTNQSLRQAALTLKNNVRFLESKAANGEKPAAACPTLTGWAITFAASSYSYRASCGGVLTGTSTVVSLAPSLLFSPIPSPGTVTFNVLTHGTTLTSPLSVIIVSPDKQYTVQINPSGDISDIGASDR